MSENKIDWNENDTYIQKDAITRDLGVFESPDVFFEKYPQKLNSFKEYIYKNFVRKKMNRNADKLRQKKN